MTRMTRMELEAKLQRLGNLSRDELAQEWLTAFGTPAPRPGHCPATVKGGASVRPS
jgi:hypothetical protein